MGERGEKGEREGLELEEGGIEGKSRGANRRSQLGRCGPTPLSCTSALPHSTLRSPELQKMMDWLMESLAKRVLRQCTF
jgi:hypothetical protein